MRSQDSYLMLDTLDEDLNRIYYIRRPNRSYLVISSQLRLSSHFRQTQCVICGEGLLLYSLLAIVIYQVPSRSQIEISKRYLIANILIFRFQLLLLLPSTWSPLRLYQSQTLFIALFQLFVYTLNNYIAIIERELINRVNSFFFGPISLVRR